MKKYFLNSFLVVLSNFPLWSAQEVIKKKRARSSSAMAVLSSTQKDKLARDSGYSSSLGVPFSPTTPLNFVFADRDPLSYYRFILINAVHNEQGDVFQKLLNSFHRLEPLQKFFAEFNLSISLDIPPVVKIVKTPFLYDKRICDWLDDPETALRNQGYYGKKIKSEDKETTVEKKESELSSKEKLLAQYGKDMIITDHSFPKVIDIFTEHSYVSRAGGSANFILPGEIKKDQGSYYETYSGIYSWAPQSGDKNRYIFHRSFLIEHVYGQKQEKSSIRDQKVQAQGRYVDKMVHRFRSLSAVPTRLEITQIIIESEDGSVAFVTDAAVFVVSPCFPDKFFILYYATDDSIKMGEKKSYQMPLVFDKDQKLQYRVLYDSSGGLGDEGREDAVKTPEDQMINEPVFITKESPLRSVVLKPSPERPKKKNTFEQQIEKEVYDDWEELVDALL